MARSSSVTGGKCCDKLRKNMFESPGQAVSDVSLVQYDRWPSVNSWSSNISIYKLNALLANASLAQPVVLIEFLVSWLNFLENEVNTDQFLVRTRNTSHVISKLILFSFFGFASIDYKGDQLRVITLLRK
jgi:hypothetical protein